MNHPRLISRADDLGTFDSATRAIDEACTRGICRNVSVMAVGPACAAAAAVLAERGDICFGLHMTISCEWSWPRWAPLCEAHLVPSLVAPDGGMWPTPKRIHERGAVWAEIERELNRQLERARDLGFPLAYVDTHMPWEWMHEPGGEEQRFAGHLRRWAQAQGLRWYRDAAAKHPFPAQPAAYAEALRALADGVTVLDFEHPCYDDAEMARVAGWGREPGPIGPDRDRQRRLYCDPAVLAAVAERGIELCRYDSLLPAPPGSGSG